jgi:hypothetical protein
MRNKKMEYDGMVFESKNYGEFMIIKYRSYHDIDIIFAMTGTVSSVSMCSIKSGRVKDVMRPFKYGIGYIGIGKHRSMSCGIKEKAYTTWNSMLDRCYGSRSNNSTYSNVCVCMRWLNYQNFANWYYDNYINGFELDKDLIGDGTKYSPETCCFLPSKINTVLRKSFGYRYSSKYNKYSIRVTYDSDRLYVGNFENKTDAIRKYKEIKTNEILRLAEEFKSYISNMAYLKLINYEV